MLTILGHSILSAQGFHLQISSRPLGEALSKVSELSGTMLSFNQSDIDRYTISSDTTFSSADDALRFLLSGLPYKIRNIKGVRVIVPLSKNLRLTGLVAEKESGEPLSFALILYDERRYLSDENGYFTIPISEQSGVLKIRYMGYKAKDTTISAFDRELSIYLEPSSTLLKEATLEEYETGNSLQTGDQPALIKLNHIVSAYLPGNGDNSIFNLMRIMPGIRAAGEQNGFSVWSSKPGESALLLDGARLFSMNGYNNQISIVNPFMVRDIRVHKGGYGTLFSNQTGAIAEITGISGNINKPEFKLNLNNQTANIFSSLPLGGGNVLAASYRQTFYNLFSPLTISQGAPKNELKVDPDYTFRDANIRFSGSNGVKSSYKISLMGSSDKFLYDLENESASVSAFENNQQLAGSANFTANLTKGSSINFSAGYTLLDNNSRKIIRVRSGNVWKYNKVEVIQEVSESFLKASYSRDLFTYGKFIFGLEGFRHNVSDSLFSNSAFRFSVHGEQDFSFKGIYIRGGLRADYFQDKFYFQPRASAIINIWGGLKANLAWGIYNQFTGKVTEIFEETAPVYVWKLLGTGDAPPVRSFHSVAGLSWSSRGFNVSLDGYRKRSSGVSQIIRTNHGGDVLSGEASITGADLFLKWENRGSQVFGSVSFGQANEIYSEVYNYKYNPLELKAGAVVNLFPFWISGSYVYGKGYLDAYGSGKYSSMGTTGYSRLDLSATYEYNGKKMRFRTGLSILNVLNTQNKKTLEILSLNEKGQGAGAGSTNLTNLYSEAIPFSPALYMEISF